MKYIQKRETSKYVVKTTTIFWLKTDTIDNSMGKALYRKYRSTKLSEIVGQEHIVEVLKNALEAKKISHAYLFTGSRGVGKTSIARILAHEINGFPYEVEDEYTDIIEIDAASHTGVDNIRNLIDNAPIAPTKGRYKIYIIDEVHMLSKSAFNALLKTLEEPPAHVVFIMATTESHKIPATILSRSQRFNFKPAEEATIVRHLRKISDKEDIKISDAALAVIARAGKGSFRDSIGILDQVATIKSAGKEIDRSDIEQLLGVAESELISGMIEAYERQDVKLLDTLSAIFADGHDPKLIAERLLEYVIEHPSRTRLDLAEKLIAVLDSPSAKVKLMAVLADFGEDFNYNSAKRDRTERKSDTPKKVGIDQTDTVSPQSDAPAEPASKTTKKPTLEFTSPPIPKSQPAPATPEPTPTPTATPSQKPTPEPAPDQPSRKPLPKIDKTAILNFIRQKSVPLYALLKELAFETSGEQLKIFATTTFAKKKIDKPAYKNIIAEATGGGYTIIIEIGKRPPSHQAMSKIADIMGGGEEIAISEDSQPDNTKKPTKNKEETQ